MRKYAREAPSGSTTNRGLKKSREVATVNKTIKKSHRRPLMQIIVSLIVEMPASAEINEIEQQVQEAGRQAMREATQKAVRAAEEQRKNCPHCGSEAVRSQGTDRRIILTKFGRVALSLRRQRCQGCRRRFCPADGCLKSL